MTISSFDHVAIPIDNEVGMVKFYESIGFLISKLDKLVYAVQFGENKIHFHLPELWKGGKFDLRGPNAIPGCGDFCFVWNDSLENILLLLDSNDIKVIEGPEDRVGGRNGGQKIGKSVYVRDPDENLLEFIVYE